MNILRDIKRGLLVAAVLLPVVHTVAQTLPSSGTWGNATISSDEIVNLVGNIQLTGTITISDKATLTINNFSETGITIVNSATLPHDFMFKIEEGAKLVIVGTESGRIVIDGGAGHTWNDADYTLSGGDANKKLNGAAIRSQGTLELRNVTACNTIASNGFLHLFDTYSSTPQMGPTTIENCMFENNSASDDAGGSITISVNVPYGKAEDLAVRISKSTFRYNVGGGGAIRSYGSAVSDAYLTDCLFEKNFSRGQGGALLWNAHGLPETKLVVDGCTFRYNKSTTAGGAIDFEGNYEFINHKSLIYSNEAETHGGGLAISGYANSTYSTHTDMTFMVNDFMHIYDNKAQNCGGGIAFLFSDQISLTNGSSFVCNISGGLIENNTAGEDGGGIYFNNFTKPEMNYKFTMNMNAGTIQNNTASRDGGGIYATNFDIKGNDGLNPLRIQENKAERNGGGIYMKGGSMDLSAVTVYKNQALGIKSYDGDDGSKGDGGGIYVNSGNFSIYSGGIIENESSDAGGGLFVTNKGATAITTSLYSGKISGNKTGLAGGGIYAYGNSSLTIDGVDIEENTACNGGGIMVKGISSEQQANLTYSSGLIINNRATGTDQTLATAYQTTVENLNGIGGGIIVGAYAAFDFDIAHGLSIGIYDNLADKGADDIFASSEVSKITLLDVQSMSLSGKADSREHQLFWVEDYVANDTQYDKGTNMKGDVWSTDKTNQRYRDVRDGIVDGNIYQVSAGEYNKYLSLTLGWSSNYITLEKKGMAPKDNAIFKISRMGNDSEYMIVILTDNDAGADGTRRKTIKIEDGEWIITETSWSWAYTNNPSSITRTLNYYSTPADRTFTFTNTAKEDSPMHSESVKVNEMVP